MSAPDRGGPARRPVALVTGASRGLGEAIAMALAPTHHLLLGGRDVGRLEALCARLPSARPWVVDLLNPEAIERAIGDIPAVDALVHSAGVYPRGAVRDIPHDTWQRAFQVNVFAAVRLTQALLPALRESRGSVVFLNSGAGLFGYRTGSLYAATKFALRAFADTLRLEEEGTGVRVTSLYPGRVATDLLRESVAAHEAGEYHQEDYMRPEDVAAAVAFALSARPGVAVEEIRVRAVGRDPVR